MRFKTLSLLLGMYMNISFWPSSPFDLLILAHVPKGLDILALNAKHP